MSYGGSGGGSEALSALTDVALSNPTLSNTLVYNTQLGKWVNGPDPASITASVVTQTSGSLSLTPGTSTQLSKLKMTLSGNLTISFASTTNNAVFDISMIETVFNGYSVTVGSDVFSYATAVRYVCIAGNWERVL